VDVVWHYDSNAEVECSSVVMKTTLQDDLADTLGKNPAVIGAECYEVLLVIALKMRKLSPIESLRHRFCVGTAALGCRGAKPRSVEV
jgi:hypothetical protein